MSKNVANNSRNADDIWICSQCKTFFETKRKLLTHLEGTCKLNSTEIRLRDLKYNRIRVLGPKSIKRSSRESLNNHQSQPASITASIASDERNSDSSSNQQETVEENWRNEVNCSEREQRKRERFTIYEEINDSLYKWFLQAKKEKLHLSGPILQDKAKEIAKQLGTSEFKASNGWLQGFKKRKGIAFNRTGFPILIDSANSDSQSDTEKSPNTDDIYTDQVENLRMYNLRPVNPNLHLKLKKDEFNNYSITDNCDNKLSTSLTSLHSSTNRNNSHHQHNQSLPASITLTTSSTSSSTSSSSSSSSTNQTRKPDKLIIVHSTPTSSSASASASASSTSISTTTSTLISSSAAHKLFAINGAVASGGSSTIDKPTVASVTSTLLKYNNNKDLPQIKYYGSLRNNSNFSKQCMLSSSLIIMNGTAVSHNSNEHSDVTKSKNTHANTNQSQLGKRSLSSLNNSNLGSRIAPKSTRLQQMLQQQQQQQQQMLNGSKGSTLIDISSDEDGATGGGATVDSKESVSIKTESSPNCAPIPPIQYGIPIVDFSDEDAVRKCVQNGIKSFMPLKGLNIKDKSDLYLPILQIQDIEKRNFIPTSRYLSIGTLKTFMK